MALRKEFAMPVGHAANQALLLRVTIMQARRVRFGPRLVYKDRSPGINFVLMAAPLNSPPGEFEPFLLGGLQSSFYSSAGHDRENARLRSSCHQRHGPTIPPKDRIR
jgi:hypothetical protein